MLHRINIRITVAVIILAGIVGYTGYEFRHLLDGPMITILEPKSGAMLQTPVTEIKGNVQNMTEISMNDRPISVNEKGDFQEKFVLSEGNNVVKVTAQDRFGRLATTYVEVLYDGPSASLTLR